jgi:Flp pilus assembly protein TadB
MKDFEAIKELWKVQKKAPINYDSIIKSVSSGQKKYAQKLIIQTVCVSAILTTILFIWFFKPFFTWTTHLSMFVLCFCLVYFMIMQWRDYKNVSQSTYHLLKPQDFIEHLEKYKKESYLLNKKNYKIYTLGIGLAFILILFEMYFILSFWVFILFIILTFSWFILSYLLLMKSYIKTENERIENMILQLEDIKNQLEE